MKSITTRVSPQTYDHLVKAAQAQGVTLGNLMRQMADFFCQNDIDLRQSVYQGNDHLCQLVEEIHAVIPHLVMYSRGTFSGVTESLDNAAFNKLMGRTLDKVTEICGGFQSTEYKVISVAYNAKRLKTLPIDPNKSTWRQ